MQSRTPRVAADADADGEAQLQAQIRRDLGRNYLAHMLHGVFGQTGFRLITAPTFVPAYVFSLSGSSLVVGLVAAAQALGQCLSPLFSATLIERRRRVLRLGLGIGTLMRLQILGIAVAGFFLGTRANLVAVCVFLALFGVFIGMQAVLFNVLMSKVIPVSLRGRLTGLRNALAGVISGAVGYFGGTYFIEQNTLGNGYATTFLLAFALTQVGLLTLLLIREPDAPVVRERTPVGSRLAALPGLVRDDPNYAAFLGACVLAALGRMALPYYVIYAQQSTPLGGRELGLLTASFLIASMCTGVLWGALADRWGFRSVFLASLALWIAGTLALIQSDALVSLLAVFSALGAGSGGLMMSQHNLVLEFGRREDLPMRIAAAHSATEAMGVLAPPLGGLLAAQLSFTWVLGCAVAFKLAAAFVVVTRLREPRQLS